MKCSQGRARVPSKRASKSPAGEVPSTSSTRSPSAQVHTLRNIIGDLELDQSLTSRDHINTQMRSILDEATDSWGIKVNRVELKNIMPPRDIQESMEKQMRAERERRESILQAEGQKQSQILVAEGEKQSAILRADAAKQAAILQAEGAKQAKILEAEAQAQAILKVQQATGVAPEAGVIFPERP